MLRLLGSHSALHSFSRLRSPLASTTRACRMLHHLMVGTWTPPGAIFTFEFDDERLTLKLIKRTPIPENEPISWMTFDVSTFRNPELLSWPSRASMQRRTYMELQWKNGPVLPWKAQLRSFIKPHILWNMSVCILKFKSHDAELTISQHWPQVQTLTHEQSSF